MNIPKVIRKYCAKCNTHTDKRSPFTRLEKDVVPPEVNVVMLNVNMGMVDRNSQNLLNQLKSLRKLLLL